MPIRQGQINNGKACIPSISPILPPKNIRWKIITPDVVKLLDKKVEQKEIEPYVYTALSSRDYLLFTSWLNEVIVYLKSQKAIQKHISLNNK